MNTIKRNSAIGCFFLGLAFIIGLSIFGYLIANSVSKFYENNRVIRVKGLAEKQVHANAVLWPIQFQEVSNVLDKLYLGIETKQQQILTYLQAQGIELEQISIGTPIIKDRAAYGSLQEGFRYNAKQTITVYSHDVERVRLSIADMYKIAKKGIVFNNDYNNNVEYIYTGLNEIKPEMIEQATRNARNVALKFAKDSKSQLGKIKTASQGRFSIGDRDTSHPHIKKVRVVSTIEYYLSD